MAKVKITGHASGTGILTVTAPNTSTDRTITLPDATGTLLTSNTPSLTVRTATNEEDAILIEQSDGTDVGSLRINNGSFLLKGKHSSNPVQIQTHDGNEDIEVDPDGFIKFEAAGSERMRVSADGLTFNGDTAAANALDDYEEGTYTPTMSGSSSGNFVAGTNSLLTYTKVGRLVTVTGKLEPNTDQSLSGTIYFTLPFTSATDTLKEGETAGNVFMRSGGTEIPNNLSVIVGAGQTTTYISWAQADSSSENIGHNQVDGAFDVWFGFTYCAA